MRKWSTASRHFGRFARCFEMARSRSSGESSMQSSVSFCESWIAKGTVGEIGWSGSVKSNSHNLIPKFAKSKGEIAMFGNTVFMIYQVETLCRDQNVESLFIPKSNAAKDESDAFVVITRKFQIRQTNRCTRKWTQHGCISEWHWQCDQKGRWRTKSAFLRTVELLVVKRLLQHLLTQVSMVGMLKPTMWSPWHSARSACGTVTAFSKKVESNLTFNGQGNDCMGGGTKQCSKPQRINEEKLLVNVGLNTQKYPSSKDDFGSTHAAWCTMHKELASTGLVQYI